MTTKIITPITISLLATNASFATIVLPLDFSDYVVGTEVNTRSDAPGTWYDDKMGLIYEDIVDLGLNGPIIGAKIRKRSPYSINGPDKSGVGGTNNAKVGMLRDTSTLFRLSFFDQSTGDKVDTSTFGDDFSYSLSFYDLDGKAGSFPGVISGVEQVKVFGATNYTVLTSNDLEITNVVGSVTARSTVDVFNITEPDGAMTLAQERINIVFGFTNQAEVDFRFTIIDGDPDRTRNLYIDGDYYTSHALGATTTVAVPEPSSHAFLGMSAVYFLSRRKQRVR